MPDRFRGVRETRATGRLTLPDAVSEEAFRLVEEEGPEQLNLRRLAERMAAKGMKFSKTAPLHHFGSMTDFTPPWAGRGSTSWPSACARCARSALPRVGS